MVGYMRKKPLAIHPLDKPAQYVLKPLIRILGVFYDTFILYLTYNVMSLENLY